MDQALGAPLGSTGNHFPTRAALMSAIGRRVLERDTAALARLPHQLALDHDTAVEVIVATMTGWLNEDGRPRQIARIELMLHSRRDQQLQDYLADARRVFMGVAAATLRAVGCSSATDDAAALVMFFDGLLINQLFYPATVLSEDELRRHVKKFITV